MKVYEAVLEQMMSSGVRYFSGMVGSTSAPYIAQLAELFGCRGYRVDQPGQFNAALTDALSTGEPCIIDVIIDPDARPPRAQVSREAR